MENINWYPGHMVKAQNEIKDNIKLIDVVVEILDSRIPKSSRNYKFDSILGDKPRIIVLNKSDLADKNENMKWIKYYKSLGYSCILLDTIKGIGFNELKKEVIRIGKENLNEKQKKMEGRSIKVLIIGIPNVGKSSIINKITGRTTAEVGNKPGVTKKKQWIRIDKDIELMDTPGILYPDLSNDNAGLYLAVTGNIKQEILDVDTISFELLKILRKEYFENIKNRYNLDEEDKELEDIEIFEKIGLKRGCIKKGQEIDYTKIANVILVDFKEGKLGNITLEKV